MIQCSDIPALRLSAPGFPSSLPSPTPVAMSADAATTSLG